MICSIDNKEYIGILVSYIPKHCKSCYAMTESEQTANSWHLQELFWKIMTNKNLWKNPSNFYITVDIKNKCIVERWQKIISIEQLNIALT